MTGTISKDKKLRTEPIPRHRILREVYRHFYEFEAFVSSTGNHVIDYTYFVYNDAGEVIDRVPISISFYDLREGIEDESVLSERKRQAVMLNVIRDMKQRDVAEIMGITTVSVGQYVEQAMLQLSEEYFPEDRQEDSDSPSQ